MKSKPKIIVLKSDKAIDVKDNTLMARFTIEVFEELTHMLDRHFSDSGTSLKKDR